MQIQTVTFSEPKEGNAPDERQDGACGGVVGDGTATPHRARFVVLDGATGAYDAVRWVDQLVSSFAPQAGGDPKSEGPRLEPAAMRAWFAEMQDQWAADVRDFDSIIEERKFAEVGSFATLLGFEIHGLDGPEPYWQAVALGDTVLFHVRMGRMIATFADGTRRLRHPARRRAHRARQSGPDDRTPADRGRGRVAAEQRVHPRRPAARQHHWRARPSRRTGNRRWSRRPGHASQRTRSPRSRRPECHSCNSYPASRTTLGILLSRIW